MNRTEINTTGFPVTLSDDWTDEHIEMALDSFANQIDNQIQTTLMSELMSRHAEISKQLERNNRELARSDASRREAQTIALMGSWELDLASKKLWWSDTMHQVLQLEGDLEPDAQIYLRRIHPADREATLQLLEQLGEGIAPAEFCHRLILGNGKTKWVHIRYVVLRDSEGRPQTVRGSFQDITAAKEAEEKLKQYNEHLEELVKEKVAEISASQMATIYALVKLAESRDDDTGEHISRTSAYCRLLAEQLWQQGAYPDQIDPEFIESVAKASPLHDIGKVGIPDRILLKPGRLTPEEFEIMKTHVNIGCETLAGVAAEYKNNAFILTGMDIALCHHEKWDGSGYPNQLKGEEIPISARIMALADVYDALRSKRVYKPGYSHEKSMEIIVQGRGQHFDPLLVDILQQNEEAFRRIFDLS